MKKTITSIALSSLMLLSLGACGGTASTEISDNQENSSETTADNQLGLVDPGIIHVATNPEYAPFEYMEGNDIVGFDIELFDAVAEDLGVEVEYSPLAFETIIPAVQSGQYDVGVSAFTQTPERTGRVLFSNTYYSSAQVALVPVDSAYTSVDELKDKKLAASVGTTGEEAANTISTDITLVDAPTALPMLSSGQVDAFICDTGVAASAAETGKFKVIEEPITSDEIAMVFSKDSEALCNAVNESLEEYMQTQDYQDLLVKYGLN